MREYEFTFVVQPEITEEGLDGICQKLESTLERTGATRLFYEDWGRRRLAYEIQKFQKGHYMVLHYLDAGTAVPEVERLARLEDSVLRFLTVLADDEVVDVEARKAEAAQLEDERKKKAAERAVRDAEEAAARAAEEEAARQAAAAQAAEAAAAKPDEDAEASEGEEETKSAAEGSGDETPAAAEGDQDAAKDAAKGEGAEQPAEPAEPTEDAPKDPPA